MRMPALCPWKDDAPVPETEPFAWFGTCVRVRARAYLGLRQPRRG
jgi:hypothetical protein